MFQCQKHPAALICGFEYVNVSHVSLNEAFDQPLGATPSDDNEKSVFPMDVHPPPVSANLGLTPAPHECHRKYLALQGTSVLSF